MKVIVATKNQHKLTEFSRILGPLGYQLVSQGEVCPDIEVEEDGDTFLENARKKAVVSMPWGAPRGSIRRGTPTMRGRATTTPPTTASCCGS